MLDISDNSDMASDSPDTASVVSETLLMLDISDSSGMVSDSTDTAFAVSETLLFLGNFRCRISGVSEINNSSSF